MADVYDLKKEIMECELCTRCGTCVGVCPTEAIHYIENEFLIDEDKCIHCQKCYQSCPGKYFSMQLWSETLYGKEYQSSNVLGYYKKIWNASSADEKNYQAAASGGIVTQLCIDMLKEKIVDGVVATRPKANKPYEFEVFIAHTEEEVVSAAKSKYVIIPVNAILQDIKKSGENVAFVGLPCQIHGLRKVMEHDVNLKKQIKILISIFCGFNMEFEATEYLIKQSKVPKEEIEELSYRHKKNGETGFYIRAQNRKDFFVNKHGYTFMNLIFSPKRCWKCFDYSGEFADVSVGDAWEGNGGKSRVIVRTDIGEAAFKTSLNKNTIIASEVDEKQILKTQKKVVTYKKRSVGIRKKMMKNFPEYEVKMPCLSGKEKIEGYILYAIMLFFKTKIGRIVLKLIPFNLMMWISVKLKRKEIQ